MENHNNENNTCGRCGAQFQGIKCPQCGLVMCENIIDNVDLKKNLFNTALLLLMDKKMISKEDRLDNAYISFFYLLASKDKEVDNVLAAFKIVTALDEFYFNVNGKSMQVLKSDGKEEYEREFYNVRKIHKITDTNKNDYELPIIALKNFEQVECKHCHSLTNPYDILCNNCHLHIANDYPTYYQDFIYNVSFENNVTYNITFVVPNNLKVTGNGSGGYFTLMDEVGPKFISYKFFNRSVFDNSNDKKFEDKKEEIYLERQLKSKFVQKENENVLFVSEVKFADNLYAIMEYQINDAKSKNIYNERDIKRYLAILYSVAINGNGYVDKFVDEKSDSNLISNINSNKKKLGGIIGLLVIIALIVGVILFGVKKETKMVLKTFDRLIVSVPDNYKEHSQLDLSNTSILNFDNEKCKVQLKKSTKFQKYNFDTSTYNENNYTPEELYSGVVLEERTINGIIWYYHSPKSGNYIYDYINKNLNYQVNITSSDDEYCRVNDIIDSLIIK